MSTLCSKIHSSLTSKEVVRTLNIKRLNQLKLPSSLLRHMKDFGFKEISDLCLTSQT